VEVRLLPPPPPPRPEGVHPFAIGGETPEPPRVQRRGSFLRPGVSLVLVAGLAGGAAVRFLPDLVAPLLRFAAPATAPVETAEHPPATSAEPTGAAAYGERASATRAERGSGQRAR
jgi:hypothetical protein